MYFTSSSTRLKIPQSAVRALSDHRDDFGHPFIHFFIGQCALRMPKPQAYGDVLLIILKRLSAVNVEHVEMLQPYACGFSNGIGHSSERDRFIQNERQIPLGGRERRKRDKSPLDLGLY